MSKVLMVIAPETFRDEEYAEPKAILEKRGAQVVTASTRPGECRGKLGMVATADVALADVNSREYDAIVFVGGAGAEVFFDDFDAHEKAAEVHDNYKVVAAICIAPSILARTGLLNGRKATAFQSQERDLVAHGATYTGERVQVSGKIITARGPEAASQFGDAIADAIRLPKPEAPEAPKESALDSWTKRKGII